MFRGVFPILHTPFLPSQELDLESLRREVDYVCKLGASGMAYPGYNSEWWKLSDTETLQAAEVVLDARKGNAAVILNVTAQTTHLAREQAKRFARMGCDALMCLPPFVVSTSSSCITNHLRCVLEATDKPHIIQYAASLTGTRLDGIALRAMHEAFPHFRAIKVDFIPTGPAIKDLKEILTDDTLQYLVGYSGLQLFDAVARGADGLMGGVGHVGEDIHLLNTLQLDSKRGYEAFARMVPMLNFEMQSLDMVIAVHKRLLLDRGVFAWEGCRDPGLHLDDQQLAELALHLNHIHGQCS